MAVILLVVVNAPSTVTLLVNVPFVALIFVVLKLPEVILPVTPNVVPIVAELLTVNAFTVAFPLDCKLVKLPVLGVALPTGVFCIPPWIVNCAVARVPAVLILPAIKLPVTPSVLPIVAELLTVSALTVALPEPPIVVPCIAPLLINALTVAVPLDCKVVKLPVLGVTLPTGVFCKPAVALNVVPMVAELLTVNALTVAFPPDAIVVTALIKPVVCKLPDLIVPKVPVITLPVSLTTFE